MEDSEGELEVAPTDEFSESQVIQNGNEKHPKEKVKMSPARVRKEKNPNETIENGKSVKSPPSEKVKVIVRCRPLSKKESEDGHTPVVNICRNKNEIEIRRPNPSSTNLVHAKSNKIFTFDTVYNNEVSQKDLYEDAFRSLVDSVLEGFNGTIFAYGQTGTGKTYTMEGIRDKEEHHGVIPHAFKHIFQNISDSPSKKYLVRASYLEIYQEEIRDLLYKDRIKHCELKEGGSGVYVKDLSSYLCANFNQINDLMTRGNKNRSVGATNMNEHSSRSHAIFMITIEASEKWSDGRTHFKVGKLNLVDLAGSERQGKSGAEGERLKEAVKINLSLSALGNVIASLADGRSSHIPYRDSKLTRLLQDSLGGNSRTIMVATIGPACFNYDETMTTLRYASRAKRIKNKPKINEDPKDAMLREYQEEISKLRAELAARKEQNPTLFYEPTSPQDSSRPKSKRARPTTAIPIEGLKLLDDKHYKDLMPVLEQYGLSHTRDPKEIMDLLEERKRELMKDNQTVKEEKERLIRKLEETQDKVKGAKEECFKLYDRIDWLESKVLNGGKSLLDHTNEQQKLIEQRKKELEEQKQREEDILKKIAEQEMSTNEVREYIANLEGDISYKKSKYARLAQKLDRTRDRIVTTQFEFTGKRSQMENIQTDMQKELKLKKLVTDNFIPARTKDYIESLTSFEQTDETFHGKPLASIHIPRPPVNRMIYTPLYTTGDYNAVEPAVDLYYTDSNVLQLKPDISEPLTREKPETAFDPHVTSLLNRAFSDVEKEVVIDCTRFNQQRIRRSTGKARHGEIINLEKDQYVRPILSAKLPSTPGIKYRDFVILSKIPKEIRGKSAKGQRPSTSFLPPLCVKSTTSEPNGTSFLRRNPDHYTTGARYVKSPTHVCSGRPQTFSHLANYQPPQTLYASEIHRLRYEFTDNRHSNPPPKTAIIGASFTVSHPLAKLNRPKTVGEYEEECKSFAKTETPIEFVLRCQPTTGTTPKIQPKPRTLGRNMPDVLKARCQTAKCPEMEEIKDRIAKRRGEFEQETRSRPSTAAPGLETYFHNLDKMQEMNFTNTQATHDHSSTPGMHQLSFLSELFNVNKNGDSKAKKQKSTEKYFATGQITRKDDEDLQDMEFYYHL